MSDFLIANYHAHTPRCLHAGGSEREYIETAIRMGIKTFGFSDHIPCNYKDGYVSNIRMPWSLAQEYVETIRMLADEYINEIRILVGFEAEYIPEFFEEQMQMKRALGVDYMIMGQHFWTSENKGPYSGAATKDDERIRNYVDSVIAGMKTGEYLYLAHPDLINYQGLDSVYESEMERLCKEMKALQIPLELNMLGMSTNRNYPNPWFWEIAGQVGNQVVIGIDAHDPIQVMDRMSYERCMDFVESYQLHLLDELSI